MTRRIRWFVVALATAALVVAGALATGALAETPTPTPNAPTTPAARPTPPLARYHATFLSKLAAALGVDQAKLEASLKQAAKDTVDEAAKAGDLTQEQADRAKQRIDQAPAGAPGFGFGPGPKRGPGRLMPGHPGGPGWSITPESLQAAADKLGMSADDLRAELGAGKSLTQVAQAKGVPAQSVRDAVLAAAKARLDQAVKDGKLTQQQADQSYQRLQGGEWMDSQLRQPFFQPFRGKPQGGRNALPSLTPSLERS